MDVHRTRCTGAPDLVSLANRALNRRVETPPTTIKKPGIT